MWLFVTMRAILDSKFAEHKLLAYSCPNGIQNISRFPDFVYSWMGNFYYDMKSFKVKPLEPFDKDKADNYRL